MYNSTHQTLNHHEIQCYKLVTIGIADKEENDAHHDKTLPAGQNYHDMTYLSN